MKTDRLRKTQNAFEIQNKAFSEFYSPFEHLAVHKAIVLFKGRVVFRHYIPKKPQMFWHKNIQIM
jgi:hypothetical protein